MSPNCFQRLSFLLLLLALTAPALSLDWQGTGNMTQDNMTEIWNAIGNNNSTLDTLAGAEVYSAAAQAISTRLNTIWNPAWNVAIIKTL